MTDSINNRYGDVPSGLMERLLEFRSSHRPSHLDRSGLVWEYISCGNGNETLVLLPGGMRFGDAWFLLIMALEDRFKIIAPTYPQVTTMAGLVQGIIGITESEGIEEANYLGSSLGGWLSQCIVRQHPDKVKKLILANTSAPDLYTVSQARAGLTAVRYLPFWYMKLVSKQRLLKLISPPVPERQFWKAYLNEKFKSSVTKKDITSQMEYTLDYVSNYNFTPGDLAEWQGKLLILESDDDLAVKPELRDSFKLLYPVARIYTLRNSGHTPGYRGVPEYIDVIRRFISDTL